VSDIWLIELEQAQEAFARDGDEETFRAALKALGLDPHEIEEEIHAATA
jgi:hypothetical protein